MNLALNVNYELLHFKRGKAVENTMEQCSISTCDCHIFYADSNFVMLKNWLILRNPITIAGSLQLWHTWSLQMVKLWFQLFATHLLLGTIFECTGWVKMGEARERGYQKKQCYVNAGIIQPLIVAHSENWHWVTPSCLIQSNVAKWTLLDLF